MAAGVDVGLQTGTYTIFGEAIDVMVVSLINPSMPSELFSGLTYSASRYWVFDTFLLSFY